MTGTTQTLLTGATGTLGQALCPRLADVGHAVRAASRSPPGNHTVENDCGAGDPDWIELDLTDGTGVRSAVDEIDVIVHAATAPRGDSEAVDVHGTERLLAAATDAGISNFVFISTVGVDEIPLTYYEHKLAAERAVEESPVPSTIVRATQFHEFVFDLFESISRLPIWPLPTAFRLQPIDVREVADTVVDHATTEPAGRVPPVGGPEVLTVGDLARTYRDARELRRPIVRLPIPGSVAAGFRSGGALCPDRTVGSVTWPAWLAVRDRQALQPEHPVTDD